MRTKKSIFWGAIVALLCANGPTVAAQECPAERAQYTYMSDPTWLAGFKVKPGRGPGLGKMYLYVASTIDKETYWFFFDEGSSGIVYIYSIKSPDANYTAEFLNSVENPADGPLHMSNNQYFGINLDLSFAVEFPSEIGDPAPGYIFLPGLHPSLNQLRKRIGPSFFKLTGCG